jgi:plastocyanin
MKTRLAPLLGAILTILAFTAIGCSDDDASPSGTSGGDAGADAPSTPADGGTSDAAPADTDTGPGLVNGCATFVDRSDEGASRELTWDFSITNAPERCMKIAVGQTVVWTGDLTTHPLGLDGVTPSDVTLGDTEATAIFQTAGTYGFSCLSHPAMNGAILVE